MSSTAASNEIKPASPVLFVASDHAGFELKSHLLRIWPNGLSLPHPSAPGQMTTWTWKDHGPFNADRVDYPDFAQTVCRELLLQRANEDTRTEGTQDSTQNAALLTPKSFALLICGSGQGMAMAANRFKGIRAALTWNQESTRLSRAHNDANILCLGARLIEPALAVNLVETFLLTPFEGGRHTGRIAKLEC